MRQTVLPFAALLSFALLCSFSFSLLKEEYGKAGYYADSLHGRKTASGQPYDKNDLTCAHKSLPFGTKLKVTRLDNKKSVIVRVNDRGPFVEGYVVDISRAAAEKIGLIKDGVTQVKVEVVEAAATARVGADTDGDAKLLAKRGDVKSAALLTPAQYSTNDPQPAGRKTLANDKLPTELYTVDIQQARKQGYGVQVSTLYDADNVLPILRQVQQDWPTRTLVSVQRDEVYKKTTYRVIVGPYGDKKAAEAQQKKLAKKYKGCFVVELNGI
jgi:rare lipoprotein A